jgi:hypothetical protein
MQQNNGTTTSASTEKRNLGWVKLRRGLREHLHKSRMSSNAVTLFVWLLLSAYHSGPRKSCVEVNIDDLMMFLGWNRSMAKRTLEELIQKGYITFEGAANQHGLGTIRITKFDTEETDSTRLTGEPSTISQNSGELTAQLSARLTAELTGEPSTEPSRPANLQSHEDLQAPKNAVEVKDLKKGKKEHHDAVRRPVDAELRVAHQPEIHGRGEPPSKPSPQAEASELHRRGFSSLKRKKKLEARIAAKLMEGGNAFFGDLDDEERAAFEFIGYKTEYPQNLPAGFVYAAWEVYEEHKDEGLSLGILCTKIIDHCMSEQKSYKTLGMDPSEYYYPPDFVEHRERLRAKERVHERRTRATTEVPA